MRILILGFGGVGEVSATMMPIIEESQCFLFTVVVGGPGSVAERWARKVGAPVEYWNGSMDYLVKNIDYVVIKIGKDSPRWYQQLITKMKHAGKHGKIITETV